MVFHPRLIGGKDSIFWLKYTAPMTDSTFPHFIHFRQDIPEEEHILSMMENAWQSAVDEVPMYENEVRYILTKVLCRLCASTARYSKRMSKRDVRDMERMKAMISWLEDHFSEEITSKQIAAVCDIGESECLRCFKRSVGCAPIQYLLEYRLRMASEMLLSEEKNISDIAVSCGFHDTSYFSRMFKAAYKLTPSAFRRFHNE